MTKNDKKLLVRIREDLHKDIKLFCVDQWLSMQEFCEAALVKHLKDSKEVLNLKKDKTF